ncbi:MAG TPA: A24 family peptidase [Nevskiaceae bacterium]
MTFSEALAENTGLLVLCSAVLGAVVGSFLNVVIARLPVMMERRWRQDARGTLGLPAESGSPNSNEEGRLSLWYPPSRCPHCHARIKPWHNVPMLSWLWLRGRCAHCGSRISVQYPLVELACCVASVLCALRFGWSPQLGAALVLTWALLTLAVIDLETMLLPDSITLPLLWLGLLLSLVPIFASPVAAILGAAVGYLVLWLIYHTYRLATGKEGMGHGDFKLLAALGAWFGLAALPAIILASSLVGVVIGLALIALRRHSRAAPLSFGPYLAGAGWLVLMAGAPLTRMLYSFGGTL